MPTWIRWPLAALLIGAAAAHIIYSTRYAWANILAQQDTVPALGRATALAPANASYWARFATLDTDNKIRWLEKALELNPSDALLWIERGVNAEMAGDTAGAEQRLLEAARRDHQYVPRWTLAAFYFRQGDSAKFQHWARQALDMAWGDALPLFQMADRLNLSLDDVRRTMLPDRAPVLGAFVYECMRRGNFDETARTARRLVQQGDPAYRTTVLAAAGRLFAEGRTGDAVDLWNQAARAHWMPHAPLDLQSGRLISNPEFSFEFLPAAFDWRTAVLDGVVYWRLGNGRGLQVELSGRQREACTLLTLPLPVTPGQSYTLRTVTSASGIEPGMGLRWRLGSQEWEAATDRDDTFEVPAGSKPLSLALVYVRALGTRRVEGTLTLRRVTIDPAPAGLPQRSAR